MKKCLFLVLLLGVIVGCQKPMETHQPLDPASWSPSGKFYVHYFNDTIIDGKTYQQCHVIWFANDTTYTYDVFSGRLRDHMQSVYTVQYPCADFYMDSSLGRTKAFYGVFTDTIHMYAMGFDFIYYEGDFFYD